MKKYLSLLLALALLAFDVLLSKRDCPVSKM